MSDVNGIARDQLRSFVERIERLEEDKKAISDDIKEVYAEAKGNGFNTKVLRRVIALRKQDQNERQEQEAILDLYLCSLGMTPDLPFDDADLPIQRKGRAPRPATGTRRTEEQGVTISLSTVSENGERGRTTPVVTRRAKTKRRDPDEALRDERAKGPVFS